MKAWAKSSSLSTPINTFSCINPFPDTQSNRNSVLFFNAVLHLRTAMLPHCLQILLNSTRFWNHSHLFFFYVSHMPLLRHCSGGGVWIEVGVGEWRGRPGVYVMFGLNSCTAWSLCCFVLSSSPSSAGFGPQTLGCHEHIARDWGHCSMHLAWKKHSFGLRA